MQISKIHAEALAWQQQKHRRQKGEKWKHTLSDPYIIHEVLEHYLKTERKPKIHNTKPRPTTQNLLNNQKKKKARREEEKNKGQMEQMEYE